MNKVSFIHYRAFNSGSPASNGGATVAIHPTEDEHTVLVSIARCNKHDVFCKKLGRDISLGRIKSYIAGRYTDKVFTVNVPDGKMVKAAVDDMISDDMAAFDYR